MHASVIYATICFTLVSANFNMEDYKQVRRTLLQRNTKISVGGRLGLSNEEKIANHILMKLKMEEIKSSFNDPGRFNFSKHYFAYKKDIEKSKVYQIIRKMPKGGALHLHSSFLLGADFMIRMTYEEHLYACFEAQKLKLQFSLKLPTRPCDDEWVLLSNKRRNSDDVRKFDKNLKQYFTMYTEDDSVYDLDVNGAWKRFDKIYGPISDLIGFRPVREKYFREVLQKFYDDNVMYMEIRSGFGGCYELDGTEHDWMHSVKMYQNIIKDFIREHPDFIGVKFILSKNRAEDLEDVRKSLDQAREFKATAPQLFAGFDLVGQEDLGKPLSYFIPVLAEATDEINFYFHGGETNWFGTPSDENLLDAILLRSKRIGHAYALIKHPELISAVKERDIALEMNVISNAVLSLVRDVRNHPLATYLAMGLPVVLSSDDPGAWDADPLSHDFYITFVGVASVRDDLRMLKQLAMNSIRYSALSDNKKRRFFKCFNRRWKKFINDVIKMYGDKDFEV